ncbi:MAG TPA: AAA domain-containing protein [Candidatus Thermoplasmatota archaeon]|nr:AAA domain-containing protein [Candidatus Thermoplasmatota archaeon]
MSLLADGRQMAICRVCGDAQLLTGLPLQIPPIEVYRDYLTKEIEAAAAEDKKIRWFKVRALDYARETRIKARLELEVQSNQYFNIDIGENCEIKFGSIIKLGFVTAFSGSRLTLSTELFPENIIEATELEVRRVKSLDLARTLLQAFEAVCTHTSDADGFLDPTDLLSITPPEVDEVHGLDDLNEEQVRAVCHARRVAQQGVALIQGPPGTGKTTVIAHLIRLLRESNQTVLVTAHTHVAIDNALERAIGLAPHLKDELVRLGTAAKISDAMEPYYRSREELERTEGEGPLDAILAEHPLVGMTLSSLAGRMKHLTAGEYTPFDFVIVDEASMNLLPSTLIARAAGHKLILVGDHMQLPPIIKDPTYASRPGFSRSSFEQIALKRPDLVVTLRVQYRSLPGIMAWSNHVLYQDRLVDHDTEGTVDAKLFGVQLEQTVAWIDTTKLERNQHLPRWLPGAASASYGNARHVALALHIVRDLCPQGLELNQLGYIAPYRLQTAVFRRLAHRHLEGGYRIESSTVDAFQGREKDVIIYDFTTTEPQKSHDSPNRLNVSLTRARHLTIIIGSKSFATGPANNPSYWSLQKWPRIQKIEAMISLDPTWVNEADVAIRTGDAAPLTRLTSLSDLIDRLTFTAEHARMLASAFEKRHDKNTCHQKLWQIVTQVAPGTNVSALYDELLKRPTAPEDENRDVKNAILSIKQVFEASQDPTRRRLILMAKKNGLDAALKREPSMSPGLTVEVARIQKQLHEVGL